MTRFWLGLFLLASSWLMGTDYYYPARWAVWAGLVTGGVLLVVGSQCGAVRQPADPAAAASAQAPGLASRPVLAGYLCLVLLLAPAVVWVPWPHRLAPLLVGLGSALALATGRIPPLRGLANGSVLAGLLFWIQDLALLAYKHGTARSHELPWPFPAILVGVARLLQMDAALEESSFMLPTMRHTHALGATWGLFLDPATVCFLAGGLLALSLAAWTGLGQPAEGHAPGKALGSVSAGKRRARGPSGASGAGKSWMIPARWRPLALWLVAVGLWLPLRAGLLMGLYAHRALLTDYEASFDLMNQFWNPWLLMILLWPLAWLQGRWVGSWPAGGFWVRLAPRPVWEKAVARIAVLGGAAAVCLTLGILWDPVGERKGGRVAIDEYHSKWEPTDRPFDTEYYGHLSGYNYACIYDYCSRFYDMSRLTNALDDAALAGLDVLIVKVPTEPYAGAERDAILRFVDRGGGLLLVGEHTDVFGTGYNLNAIARRFGFAFRYDCLFGIESFFDQYYEPSFVPHPVVQHLRGMDFATSCSIAPLGGAGRGVITSTGLKNSMADYHASNYYPQAVDHAAMRYGAFVQLWAARHGRGRVLAFTDSTVFSNFSAFEPGKSELWLGMVEWLNRQDALGRPRPLLLVLGCALLGLSLFWLRKEPAAGLPAVATAALSWTLACTGLIRWQHSSLPPPPPQRPFIQVTIDRTAASGPLSKNGFIEGKSNGFGIFERWILRLGYFTRRESGSEALAGDLVVFLYPNTTVSREYSEALLRYVESGGRILILDSPENKDSTANDLLKPFQLALTPRAEAAGGILSTPPGFPPVPVEVAHEVTGGQPLFQLGTKPVAATSRFGKGTVTVLGFGSRFSDAQMGVTGDVVPNEELRKVFDFQYALLRAIVGNKLP